MTNFGQVVQHHYCTINICMSNDLCDLCSVGVLPAAVWSKFGLLIPNNLDRSTIFHAFQLFEAVKYHCGVTFRDSNEYIFHHSTVSEPFQLLDLIAYSPIVKAFHHYPGVDHDLEALTAANMKEKMYGDALNALRIHMSVVVLSQGTHVMDQFLSPKQRVLVAHLTYQIALCHYMLKQYDLCGNVLTAHLQNAPKYTVMSARMQTLLMSSTFFSGGASSGKITAALQYFESGKALYCLTLGSLSPAHGLHACALADLYFMVNAMPQAKVANMIAQSSFQHVLGDMHPVCAAIACKIGNLLIVQKQYSSAVEILEGAFAVYQHINKQTASFANSKELIHVYYVDESHCLHALAVALRGTSEITYAMQCAVLSVDIATADDRPMTPGTVHTLLILAEMYETTSDLFTAVLLYQDVWTIVKANPHVFPMASMLVDLAGRIVCVIVDMLPLQSRTLMDTILVEAEAPVATEWDIAINMLIAELWAQEPVTYIRDTIKKALEEAGETGRPKVMYHIMSCIICRFVFL